MVYSWIGLPVNAHEKSIPEKTVRATTNPRPVSESSQQVAFKSAVSIFVMFFGEIFAFLAPLTIVLQK